MEDKNQWRYRVHYEWREGNQWTKAHETYPTIEQANNVRRALMASPDFMSISIQTLFPEKAPEEITLPETTND